MRAAAAQPGPGAIPWAVSAAAALFGGVGVAAWAAWRYHVGHLTVHHAGHSPAHLTARRPLRPRLP